MSRTLRQLGLAGAAAAALLAAGLPASAQTNDQWNALFDRIIRLEAEVKAGGGGGGGDSYRVTALEEQLRQLTGQVQQLSYQIQQMQVQLQDLEKARREGRLGPKPIRPSDTQVATTNVQDNQASVLQPGYALPSTGQTFEPLPSEIEPRIMIELEPDSGSEPTYGIIDTNQDSARTLAPGPQVLGQLPASALNGQAGAATAPVTGGGLAPQPLAPLQGGSSLLPDRVETAALDGNQITGQGPEDALYQSAYRNLLNRQFGPAEAEFTRFLTQHGDHPQAPAAQFFLGETYFAQGKNKLAAQAFLTGYREHPKSQQAPNSLLKLGMALDALGQKKEACNAFGQVKQEFPQAGETVATADAERQRAGC